MRAHRGVQYALLLPAVLWVLAFTIYPLLYSVRLSFYRVRVGRSDIFVGLDNYARMLADQRLWESARVTLVYVVAAVAIEVLLGLALALLYTNPMPGRSAWRAILSLPLFATPIAVGYLFFTIFYEEGGLINAFLPWRVPWLSNPQWAVASIVLVDVWQWTPFAFLVLLAGLQNIPEDLFEAARLEARSRWQLFRHITLPLIGPTLVIVLLFRLTEALKVLDIPFSLTGGGPGTATQVYSLYAYRTGLRFFDLGYASAMALVLLVFVMIIVTALFRRVRETYE